MITILPTKTLAETNKQVDLAALWGYEERRDFEWKVAFLLYHPESPIKWVPTKKKLAEAGLYLKKPKEVSTLQIGSELWHEAKAFKQLYQNIQEDYIQSSFAAIAHLNEELLNARPSLKKVPVKAGKDEFSTTKEEDSDFTALMQYLKEGPKVITGLLEFQREFEEGPLPKKEKGKEEKEPYNPLAKK